MAETIRLLAFGLAEAFLRGHWGVDQLSARAKSVLVPQPRGKWVRALARRVVTKFPGLTPPLAAHLRQFIETDELFLRYCGEQDDSGDLAYDLDLRRLPRPAMQPVSGTASNWAVRPLVTAGEVAEWLNISIGELDWFANRRIRMSTSIDEPLQHYRYRWLAKPSGGQRLLEIPKPRMKIIQRRILDDILSMIPPHPAAHAFRRDRSIATSVAPHVNKRIVIHLDLREFFPSVRASQVHAIFRTAGYPESLASIMTGLCTNRTPRQVFVPNGVDLATDQYWKRYVSSHLPQGSPTSPALANLAAFWLDCRLSVLARKLGADYTRYADDLVFSGGHQLAQSSSRFRVLVAAIILHEGFEIRHRKTREMRSGSRQQVAGITLNRHANIPRREYDTLRAILHNCRQHGPASQNLTGIKHFYEHLRGRIAYWSSVCPGRSAKLHAIFDEIDWS